MKKKSLKYTLYKDSIKTKTCQLRGMSLLRFSLEKVDWKDYQQMIIDQYEALTGKTVPNKKPFDYRIAVMIIRGRFLKLNIFGSSYIAPKRFTFF
ncbi:MAG: hypothetical protein JSV62_07790 [Promethearchaeota archaeon]|nr:MAG: hypothetical protein JSV62_07790 [Candidatus Lokiarchaeota archaeon]